jgi:hypothetical protein
MEHNQDKREENLCIVHCTQYTQMLLECVHNLKLLPGKSRDN